MNVRFVSKKTDTATPEWTTFEFVVTSGSTPTGLLRLIRRTLSNTLLVDSGLRDSVVWFAVTNVARAREQLRLVIPAVADQMT